MSKRTSDDKLVDMVDVTKGEMQSNESIGVSRATNEWFEFNNYGRNWQEISLEKTQSLEQALEEQAKNQATRIVYAATALNTDTNRIGVSWVGLDLVAQSSCNDENFLELLCISSEDGHGSASGKLVIVALAVNGGKDCSASLRTEIEGSGGPNDGQRMKNMKERWMGRGREVGEKGE
ncbi:hypothetical protein ACH5RR_013568 [Cinchona calisaya]|uniref:Uncharacterized protein n=1 Tax=Cinchona calisaya TaxID=153742 RepID=A0ABD3A0F3_9GENT